MGQRLLVGLNSDASVGRLKGEGRPLQPFEHRAYMLAALEAVDGVVSFDEDTPLELIKQVLPEVLVKGEDYDMSEIVGASEVLAAGGEVRNLPLVEGVSTSRVIERVRQLPDKQTTTE
jgi:D-beta-D-heptose 7-phosphate kinase/D-beta-D-heptose 1-phosphate adenosyltransferase